MTTLREIIGSTRHALSGFGTAQESVLELTSAIDASTTTIPVDDATPVGGAGRGVAEIDMELMRVKSVDPTGNLVLYGFGRGYLETTAAVHAEGAEVRINPAWPASTVAREINGVISEIFPQIYGVKFSETTFPSDQGAISIPAGAFGVIAVYVEDFNRAGQWLREDRWSFDAASSSTNKGLRVGGKYRTGEKIRIEYAVEPQPFNLAGALTQDFATVTGLETRHAELIRLGVASRMAPFFDISRVPLLGAEPRIEDQSRPPGGGSNITRITDAMFQRRIQQEAAALAAKHKIKLHFTGRA